MVPTPEILAQLQELRAELAAVKAENAWLKRQLFGPGKSEKLDRLQASLPLGEVPPATSFGIFRLATKSPTAPMRMAGAAG